MNQFLSAKYKLLRKLVLIQIFSIILGLFVLFVSYKYIYNSNRDATLVKNKALIYSELLKHEDKWRAWFELGLLDSLNEETSSVALKLGLKDLKVVSISDAKKLNNEWELSVPSSSGSEFSNTSVVYAKLDSAGSQFAQIPNDQFSIVLIAAALMFFLIVFYSAAYLLKKIHIPLMKLGESFDFLQIGGVLDTKKISASGEIRHILDQIQTMYESVKEYEKARAISLVSTQVAHDIRSPLAALKVLSSDSTVLDDGSKVLLKAIVKRVEGIAKQLLGFQKLESSSAGEDCQNVGFLNFLESLINEKKIEYSNRNIEIQLKSCGDLNVSVGISYIELGRILSNLINNSVESIIGTGIVSVQVKSTQRNVEVVIADSGCGISEDRLSDIFERGKTYDKVNGLGLGLWHAKDALNKVGAEISISSSVDVGTWVTILLPKEEISSTNSELNVQV